MPLSSAQRKRRIEQRWHPCDDAMIQRTQAHMPMTQNGRGTRPPWAELMQPRDRFKVLKNHAMQEDINPCFFYAVTGYFDYRAENRPRHKESAASSILGEIPKPLRYTHLVGGQQDRDSLKRQTADCSMSLGESSSIPKIARSILGEIPKPLRYTHQYNWADLAVVYEEAIFFVLQAYNEEVIHLSMRDRFKVLKNHAMQEDINPCFFYAVTGYFDYRAENRPRHKESAASSILGEIPKPLRYTHLVGGQQDRDSLKRQTADCSMSLGESSSIPKIARSILGEIPKPLRYTHQYNWADLAVVYEEAIFFVLQAYNEEVIHLSMRYDMLWTCSAGNHALDDAFRLAHQICAQKNCKCPIILFLKIMILKLGFTGSLTVPNVLVGMQTLPVEKKAGSSCSPAMNSKGEEDSSKLEEPKASKTPEYRMEKKAGSSCSHALNSKGKEESSGRLGKEPQASRANNPVLLSTPKSRSQGIKHKPQTGEKAASSRCSTAFNSKRGEDSSGCSSVSVPIGAMMINVNLLD
ncbi:hypothetical protein OsJ_17206 [Oryza sativa Japonica Group]|uniref:YTH domain-containing family protein n=1 Tax=Oryza sativa subsp. japonica TaxID=39947 RepID=B9FML0_ORYSJ|nr:hypothetical protein OsJ_17206 [Oryza sativa Japonica Group]